MKKRLPKLAVRFESLRLLDGPSPAGMAYTDAYTCGTSCAPTCGISPATTNGAALANTARACCV